MAWLYVPGVEGSRSDLTSQQADAVAASVWWRGKPSPSASWSKRWSEVTWLRRLSGMTSAPSTVARGVASLTSSLRASRANPSASPAQASAPTTSDGSGQTSSGSLARYDRASSCWRTCQGSLFGGYPRFSGDWPGSGSMRNGTCSQRQPLVPLTYAAGSTWSRGEYPTPTASEYGTSQNEGQVAHKRPTAGTPSLSTWAKRWPTAAASDWKGSSHEGQRRGQLSEAAEVTWAKAYGLRHLMTSMLGPDGTSLAVLYHPFVEALMGWPTGWTSFDCSETAWSRFKQRMQSELSRLER